MNLIILLLEVVVTCVLGGLVVISIALFFTPPDPRWNKIPLYIMIFMMIALMAASLCSRFDYNPQLWLPHNSPERVSERWQEDMDARVAKMRQELREKHGDVLFEALFGGQDDIRDR